MTLLQIYDWVCKWKNFENPSTFDVGMGKSIVAAIFVSQSVIISFFLNFHMSASKISHNFLQEYSWHFGKSYAFVQGTAD